MDTPSISEERIIVLVRGDKEDHVITVTGKSLRWDWPKSKPQDSNATVKVFEGGRVVAEVPRYSVLGICYTPPKE